MKKKLMSLIATVMLATAVISPVSAKQFEVDTAHSSIKFTVSHLQLSDVEGRFNDFNGKFDWNPNDVSKSSLQFAAKTNSVDTGNSKRDAHIQNSDFFDSENYPEFSFQSTKIEHLSGERYAITGDLTARGVTKQITVPATVKGPVDLFGDGSESLGFRATFKINRINYKIGDTWKGGSDKVVGHDVFLTVKGEAHAK